MAAKKCPFSTAPGQPEVGIPVTGTRRRRAHRAGAFCFLCCDHYLNLPSRALHSTVLKTTIRPGWRCGWVRLSGPCRFGVVPAGYGMRATSMPPASTFVNAVRTALCADRAAGTHHCRNRSGMRSKRGKTHLISKRWEGSPLPCGEFLNISRSHLVIYCP